jgi:hypothetical protein
MCISCRTESQLRPKKVECGQVRKKYALYSAFDMENAHRIDLSNSQNGDSSSNGSNHVPKPQPSVQVPLPSTSQTTGPSQFNGESNARNPDDVHQQMLGDAELSFSNSSGTPGFMNDLFMPDLMPSGHGGDNSRPDSGGFDMAGQFSDRDLGLAPPYGSNANVGEILLNNNRLSPTINSPEPQQGQAPFNNTASTSKLELAPLLADHLYVVVEGGNAKNC